VSAGRVIVGAALTLALAGCGQEVSPVPVAPPSSPASVVAVASSPARVDVGREGCLLLQSLGTSGSVDQYRVLAGVLIEADDAGVAAAAVALDGVASSGYTAGSRVVLLGAVLDLAEACLRVTG
jgi:hypothetical protein